MQSTDRQRVVIVKPGHPWLGRRGVIVTEEKPGPFGMVKVRLDDVDGMHQHECYCEEDGLRIDPHTCAKCGGPKAHYRTKGLRCPTCD